MVPVKLIPVFLIIRLFVFGNKRYGFKKTFVTQKVCLYETHPTVTNSGDHKEICIVESATSDQR